MKKMTFGVFLIVGIVAGSQFGLITNNQKSESNDVSDLFNGTDPVGVTEKRETLLAGNVPCNPAKQVCED